MYKVFITYFGVLDVIKFLTWILIIYMISYSKRDRNKDKPHFKYYLPNIHFKLFFVFAYLSFYLFYYLDGGDTTAYYQMATCMYNLFWDSPPHFFHELFSEWGTPGYISYYTVETGFPPYWIIQEPEAFFTSKFLLIFSFATGNSYITMSVMLATFVARIMWRLYELLRELIPNQNKYFVYGVLFIPSVAFWCTGISKDTFVFISLIIIITRLFRILLSNASLKIWDLIVFLFHLWLIYNIRTIILMPLVLAFTLAMATRIANSLKDNIFLKRITQFGIISFSLILFVLFLQFSSTNSQVEAYIQEAAVTKQDFASNAYYTGKKYEIAVTDYSLTGILKAMPLSIIAGLYQPFIWQALSPSLLMNGVEGLFFLWFSLRFFGKGFRKRMAAIRKNEFLMFCLIFSLLMAFITGFSSVLFGVLVRLRAPLLPFFAILLLFKTQEELNAKKRTK